MNFDIPKPNRPKIHEIEDFSFPSKDLEKKEWFSGNIVKKIKEDAPRFYTKDGAGIEQTDKNGKYYPSVDMNGWYLVSPEMLEVEWRGWVVEGMCAVLVVMICALIGFILFA